MYRNVMWPQEFSTATYIGIPTGISNLTDLVHLLENTFGRKRISAYLSPNPISDSNQLRN